MSTLPFRRRPLIEELEPRLLFSADLAPFALDTTTPAPEQRLLDSNERFATQTAAVRHELVIVDAGVADYATLLDDIRAQAGDQRQLEVVILDSTRDGVTQLSEVLKSYEQLDALHVIAHGAAGELQLGNQRIDAASLDARASDIAAWRQAFSAEADLLLYGCDIASNPAGEQWIASLSQLTGTEVAASTDLTGNPAQQGDWNLEAQTGAIESPLLLGSAQTVWQGTLNINPAPGQTLANETTPNQQTTTPSSRQVAINPNDGSFVVVWTGQDGGGTGVYLRQFNADGSPKPAGEIRVNTTTTNDQHNPDLAMNANGKFVVVWQSQNSGGNGFDIYGQRFNADATAQGAEFRINTTTSNDQASPSVAIDGSGGFVVAWESGDANNSGIFAQRFDSAGIKILTAGQNEFLVNSETNRNQNQPAVAMNDAGAFVIVWTSERQDVDIFDNESDGVYGRLFDATGNTVSAEFRVNWATGGNQTTPDVAMNDTGAFVVVLADDISASNPNIDAFMHSSTGTRQWFGTLATSTTGVQSSPTVAIRDTGDFLVNWESVNQDGSGYGIVARHFKSDYTAYASEQIINIETAGDQLAPSVAWNGQQAVFVWSGNGVDNQGVYFRLTEINTPPVITSNGGGNSATVSVPENTTAVTTVTANDIDNHPLSFSLSGGADASKFTIDNLTGVLSFLTAPDYEFPTDTGSNNTYQVTIRVDDGHGGSDTQTLSVQATDGSDAPVLTNDTYSTSVVSPSSYTVGASAGLLANDTGADTSGLYVSGYSQPSQGSVVVNPDGSFTYTPSLIGGSVSFIYTATNGAGASSTATVNINATLLINNPPTTSNVDLGNLNEDTARIITQTELLVNASDPDGASLSIANLTIDSGGGTLVKINSEQWAYTSAQNNTGPVTFSYDISDGVLSTTGSANLNLTPVNDAPIASPIPDQNATEDAPYSFQFAPTVFTDVDAGDTLTYTASGLPTWLIFDAGTRTFSGTPNNSDVGTVAITLRATDSGGESAETVFNFTVVNVNDAPVITSDGGAANANVTISENTTVVTTVSASDADLPAQTLTYSLAGGTDASLFSLDVSGVLRFIAAPDFESPNDANGDGIYDVRVEVTDGLGGSDVQTLAITLANINEAPTALDNSYVLDQDGALVVPALSGVLSNDTDPENDTLSITRLVSWVTHGTGAINLSTGAFNYTPDAGFTGQDSFSYEITDGQGHTATATVILNVNLVNHAPTTSPVTLAPLAEDGTRLLTQSDLLSGANDPDGDPLTAAGLTLSSGNGALVDHGNGTWTYTPALNDDSSVSFSYTVSDGSLGTSGSATLDITPVNDAPTVANALADQSTLEDAAYAFQIPAATFTDAEGGTLAYSTSTLPGWLTFNATTRTFSGTPGNSDIAASLITVRATDSSGAYVEDAFVLTVGSVNDAPTTTGLAAATVDEEAANTVIDLFAAFADIDDATLVYTLRSNSNPALFSATPMDGIAGTLTLDYAPDANGTATLTVRATDSGGLWVESTFTVTVNPVNDAPIAADATRSSSEDTPLAGSLPVATDADPDGVTYSLASAASNGTATVNPDGSFNYAPDADFNGSDSFGYRIEDGQGGSNSYTVSLTVNSVNDAPSLSVSPLNVAQTQPVTVSSANLLASDVDHAAAQLSFVLTSAPAAGTLALNGAPLAANDTFTQADLDAGRVTYTPTAATRTTDSLSLTVFDPASAQASGVLTIVVAVPAAPVEAGAPMVPPEPAPAVPAPPLPVAEPVPAEPAVPPLAWPTENGAPEDAPSLAPAEPSLAYGVAAGSGSTQMVSNAAFNYAPPGTTRTAELTLLSALDNTLKAIAAHDAHTLESLRLSLGSDSFQQQLNQLQSTIRQQLSLDKNTVASSLAISTGLSVGYVLWLVRGGVLLSSLLSTLPAWRLIDPLPILGTLKRRDEHDDDDSLEGLLKKSAADAEVEPAGEKND